MTLPEGLRGSPARGLIGRVPYLSFGAGGRTRTGTEFLPTDFKSVAYNIKHLI